MLPIKLSMPLQKRSVCYYQVNSGHILNALGILFQIYPSNFSEMINLSVISLERRAANVYFREVICKSKCIARFMKTYTTFVMGWVNYISWSVVSLICFYMSGVRKDIYYYSLQNSFFFSDRAETFFLDVLDL